MNFGIYGRKSYFVDNSESTQMQFDVCREHIKFHFSEEEISSITLDMFDLIWIGQA